MGLSEQFVPPAVSGNEFLFRMLRSFYLKCNNFKNVQVRPWGNRGNSLVREANCINVLVAAICYLAVELGIRVILEQPDHSWFYKTPQMAAAISRLGLQSITTQLGAFGVLSFAFSSNQHSI